MLRDIQNIDTCIYVKSFLKIFLGSFATSREESLDYCETDLSHFSLKKYRSFQPNYMLISKTFQFRLDFSTSAIEYFGMSSDIVVITSAW